MVLGNGRWNTVCDAQSSARGTSWLSPLLPCRSCCRPALLPCLPSPRGSGAPPRPLLATWGRPLHMPPLPALCPRPSPGSRGVFSLWSVLTPLIRPQLSFAFSPSFPDFPVLLSSFWPGRCCPKCSPVPSVWWTLLLRVYWMSLTCGVWGLPHSPSPQPPFECFVDCIIIYVD